MVSSQPCSRRFLALRFAFPPSSQQTAKIPRIGYLSGSSLSAVSFRREAFRQGLRELGYVEGKNIVVEWRFADGKSDRLTEFAAELVRLKVDCHRHRWSHAYTFCQTSDEDDSHCHGTGWRSCWKRIRCQPCAARREYYWIVDAYAGAKRKTTGAFKGDRSQALPRGRLRDFDPAGQCTSIKRDRARGRTLGIKLQYFDVLGRKDIETAFRAAAKGAC